MARASNRHVAAVLLVVIMTVAGCKAGDAAKTPTCPDMKYPVCGKDGKTYTNKCFLDAAKAKRAYDGLCKGDTSIVCTAQVDPVCGVNNKTYSNACQASRAGIQVSYKGKCHRKAGACVCKTYTYKPVCGADGKTYPNSCLAKCASKKNKKYKNGVCHTTVKICSALCDPVCSTTNKTYSNQCLLSNANEVLAYKGACGTCGCPTESIPVCVNNKDYDNACLAVCHGEKMSDGTWKRGKCGASPPLCGCPPTNDKNLEVCAIGSTEVFETSCVASCVKGFPGPYTKPVNGKCPALQVDTSGPTCAVVGQQCTLDSLPLGPDALKTFKRVPCCGKATCSPGANPALGQLYGTCVAPADVNIATTCAAVGEQCTLDSLPLGPDALKTFKRVPCCGTATCSAGANPRLGQLKGTCVAA